MKQFFIFVGPEQASKNTGWQSPTIEPSEYQPSQYESISA
jgi:hypothetical protein